RHKILHRLLQE
nr:Chain B, Nuclear receptor coactivator 1 [Homo sapiens]